MAAKKKAARRAKAPSRPPRSSIASSIKLGKGQLRIKYSDSHDLMDKLLSVTHSVSRMHTRNILLPGVAGAKIRGGTLDSISFNDPPTLGIAKALEIVSSCAGGEEDMTKKVGDVSTPIVFSNCVGSGVDSEGYKPPDYIPESPDTILLQVVEAIQDSPKKI
jgi:hypothetical protein